MDKILEFTESELNQYRAVLAIYGQYYGKKVVSPLSENLDLDHAEKEKKNINPRFAKAIKKFFTKSYTLTSFDLTRNANGKVCITINHDPQLTFPLVANDKPTMLESSEEAITNALIQHQTNGKITFFTDLEKVNEVITNLNEQNARDLEDFADSCVNFASALRNINTAERQSVTDYLNSLK